MSNIPNILIVDDDPRMCDSLKALLSAQGYGLKTSNSVKEAREYLDNDTFDLVLLDIVMGEENGFTVMDHIISQSLDTLTIFITGHAATETAIEALRKGAYDFLKKPFEPTELLKTVENGLDHKRLKSEKGVLNGKLAFSEERYRYLVQNSPDIIYTLDEQGQFTFISPAVERLLGFEVEQLAGRHYTTIIYEEDLEKAKWLFNERRTGDRTASGVKLRLKICGDGGQFKHFDVKHLTIELKSSGMYDKPVTEKGKKYLGTHGVARDLSERKLLEDQFQQAQRMEALGTLAGGIAHNFNNVLMGILGHTSLVLMDKDTSHPDFGHLKSIEKYVENAAELTKDLLGFARGGKYEVRPTDLNELIRNENRMFGQTKREIKIKEKYDEKLWTVEVDKGQMRQALLNLYVNAWQAMPDGGDLYTQTENVTLDKDYGKFYEITPGRYVKISVIDTGTGMDDATREKIFEPFFTTQEMGRGTGLGLASVYGIVKNHGGFINVYSEKGEGTTFNIYLPASEKEVIEDKMPSREFAKGEGTILLVDDEEMITDVGEQLLEKLGYRALVAGSGKEAIDVYEKNKADIDMVILDMIMPVMSGGETYDRFKEINPDIKILLSSGYSIDGQAQEILDRGCNGFIHKPFSMKQLSQELRKILDS